jgi:hypothetical protein
MIETTTYSIGKAAEGVWRRNNLLKVHHCVEKKSYFEVAFQYVEHTFNGVKQINLIYQIIK